MGAVVKRGFEFESAVTRHILNVLRAANVRYRVQRVCANRANVIATVPGKHQRKILFVTHQDTVPVSENSKLLHPKADAQRIYGRGASDAKGCIAAMLEVVREMQRAGTRPLHTVEFCFLVDEEYGFRGMRKLVGQISHVDLAVVGEPTGLRLVVAHKGCLRFRLSSKGKSAHSSAPGSGLNAIDIALQASIYVRRFFRARHQSHALAGGTTCSMTTIRGGSAINMVPDSCEIQFDVRLPPGISARDDFLALRDYLRHRMRPGGFEIASTAAQNGVDTRWGSGLVSSFRQSLGRNGFCPDVSGVSYGTDGTFLFQRGIPVVILGPGSILQAHSDNEFVSRRELNRAVEAYRLAALL